MSSASDCISAWGLLISLFSDHQCTYWYESAVPNEPFQLFIYLKFFLLTMALEFPFYLILLRKIRQPIPTLKQLLVLNLATHPFIFIVWPHFLIRIDANYLQYLVSAEIIAPAVEILLLKFVFKYDWRLSIIAAVVANVASWSIGVYLV